MLNLIFLFPQHGVPEDDDLDKWFVMKSAGQARLSDEHIWWSVWTRPYRSVIE